MFCTQDATPFQMTHNDPVPFFPLARLRYILCILTLLLLAPALLSAQATFTQLVAFAGTNGWEPYYVYLAQGTDGQLYGTTSAGYVCCYAGAGSVFKVTTTGTLTDMYTFSVNTGGTDGDQPVGGLVLAPNGNLYGTASEYGLTTQGVCDTGIWGCGTIFEITPAGVLTVLHTFSGPDGFCPTPT